MESLSIKTFGLLAVGSIAFTSCINSQEAYEKAALSGFVASQTKDIVEKNKVDLTPVQKEIKSVDMKVEALDADNKKIAATVSELEKSMATVAKLEKESKSEFERSNTAVVFFNTGSAGLSASSMQELYRWKSRLDQASSSYKYVININASADKSGPKYINDRLRQRRANAVKNFLTDVLGSSAEFKINTDQTGHGKRYILDRRAVVSVSVK